MDITITLSPAQINILESQRMLQRGQNSLPVFKDIPSFLKDRIEMMIMIPAAQQAQTPEIIAARVEMDKANVALQTTMAELSQIEITTVK